MRKKGTIALLLTLMVSVFLAACSNNASNHASPSPSASSASSETNSPSDQPSSEPLTIRILAQENYNAQLSYADRPIIKELEKRTNVKFEWEFVPPNDIASVAQTRLSAGVNLPDVIELNMDSTKFFETAQSGVFIPITKLVEQHAPNIKRTIEEEYPIAKKLWTMPDNELYSVTYAAQNEGVMFVSDIIRYDWLQKVGITKIPETTDEFYEALKAMRDKDANGNSKQDEFFSGQGWQLFLTFPAAFGLNAQHTGSNWDVDDNGKVFSTWTSDKAKAMYQYLNKLYSEGLIDPEYTTMAYDASQARLKSNIVSATSFYAQSVKKNYNDLVGGGAEYRAIQPLKGPDGTSRAIVFNVPGGYNGYNWVITKSAKNPEGIIKLFDYIFSPEGRILLQYGIENVHYKLVDGKPVSIMEEFVAANKDKYDTVQAAMDGEGLNPIGALPYVRNVTKEEAFQAGETAQADIETYEKSLAVMRMPYFSANPTLEEQQVVTEIGGEVWTYIAEMRDKFVLGQASFDEWDKYVAKANDLGITKLLEIEKKKYERFLSMK
ncbi:extracellular solute-binding protein [Paenibacillus eucommiae]|uniref:Aldouronate transport system substrate-binding protein n=1 Tax=Paenibacillus eucommiae TaxID=1355755 RepID=A0ABS4J328_9BACL|nr:extracellular solute-binding protein [Paenibacillus eucommiae]MBP1994247.1 putative aldouronate transport system substrate-binding protein [Paenibacillus eucommiae]